MTTQFSLRLVTLGDAKDLTNASDDPGTPEKDPELNFS